MEIIVFIKSINKIALLAFFVTSVFIAYEIYLLKKEREKKKKPAIPEFKVNQKYGKIPTTKIVVKKEERMFYQKPNTRLIFFLIVLMFFFGGLFLIGIIAKEEKTQPRTGGIIPTPIARIVSSPGIKIYNERWQEIPDEKLPFLKAGDKIFIGIKNISGTDTNKARIRINANKWTVGDETDKLNQKFDLFYKEYQIASGETRLKIEAQLHSQKDGWLGE